jgi:hypothetical protein
MILGLNKRGALFVFPSLAEAQLRLEAIDVQEEDFEFCDDRGQRYEIVFTIPPKVSSFGPVNLVDIGAFKLEATSSTDSELPESFTARAVHIEHSFDASITSVADLLRLLRSSD